MKKFVSSGCVGFGLLAVVACAPAQGNGTAPEVMLDGVAERTAWPDPESYSAPTTPGSSPTVSNAGGSTSATHTDWTVTASSPTLAKRALDSPAVPTRCRGRSVGWC